jgi:hypothetical protein
MTFEHDWAHNEHDWANNEIADRIGTCSKDGCERALSRVHSATGIDAEGRVGPLWTCKDHRTELWMKVGDGLVPPLEWWPD